MKSFYYLIEYGEKNLICVLRVLGLENDVHNNIIHPYDYTLYSSILGYGDRNYFV